MSIETISKEKDLTPEEYAIKIEQRVAKKYIPVCNVNWKLPYEEANRKWFSIYGTSYRIFFNDHKEELIDLFKQDLKRESENAIDRVWEKIKTTETIKTSL